MPAANEADRLIEYALLLRTNGERAPSGNETWARWDAMAEAYLRSPEVAARKFAQRSFTCSECGMTSYNPVDTVQGYCGNCRAWTGVEERSAPT